ncbi:MAG: P-loop NTPase fold protein [Cyclobacteriaceae bacterium]
MASENTQYLLSDLSERLGVPAIQLEEVLVNKSFDSDISIDGIKDVPATITQDAYEFLVDYFEKEETKYDSENKYDSNANYDKIEYFIGGHHYGDENQLPKFLNEGIWENGYKDKYTSLVDSVPGGSIIFLKSKSIRGGNALHINAVGVIKKNPKNGRILFVDWKKTFENDPIVISSLGGTFPGTFHKVKSQHIEQIIKAMGGEAKFNQIFTNPLQFDFNDYKFRDPTIISELKENLLNAEAIANVFAEIIHKSSDSSKPLSTTSQEDRFYGIFGQWGRGKTRFWRLIKKYLNQQYTKEYKFIEFHAWKYQDTPAIWAYLYESFSAEYYFKVKYKVFYPFELLINSIQSFWLSVFRNPKSIVTLTTGIVLSTASIYYFDSQTEELNKLISNQSIQYIAILTGLSVTIIGTYWSFTKPIISKARNFIELASKKNFKIHLGLQHEIQEELKFLFKAWFIRKRKKFVLFIDDIDRCDEYKMIQIVDALRVMLNDQIIQENLIVIAAIDERILSEAIRKKYKNFVSEGNLDINRLSYEYLDKLFISGIKLNQLSDSEKRDYLNGITKSLIETPTAESHSNSKIEPDEFSSNKESAEDEESTEKDFTKVTAIPKQVIVEKDLLPEEIIFLNELISKLNSATPRSIRNFLIKYLLSRNLVDLFLQFKPSPKPEWSDIESKKELADKIISVMNLTKEIHEPRMSNNELVTLNQMIEKAISMVSYYHFVEIKKDQANVV